MIDTDKYEGHTEGPWKPHMIQPLYGNMVLFGFNEQDALLASDAPKLLEEVKRLREALITVQQSLIWDEKDREMDDDPITLEALEAQVERVRSDITEMIE